MAHQLIKKRMTEMGSTALMAMKLKRTSYVNAWTATNHHAHLSRAETRFVIVKISTLNTILMVM